MSAQSKISATVICYNEEDNIEACIKSLLKVADEVVCVDSFSDDQTCTIAKRLGAKVIQNKFEGHIQQKNFALEMVQYPLVLALDADECLSEVLVESILKIKSNPTHSAYQINRKNYFCGQWIRFGGWYPDQKIRLWNKAIGAWGGTNPHDRVIVDKTESLGHLKGDIIHHSYKEKEALARQLKYFAQIGAHSYHAKGKKSNTVLTYLNPAFTFIKSYVFQLGFLDGYNGFYIAKHRAIGNFWKYKILKDLG